jgi:cytidyltransferase-like protein
MTPMSFHNMISGRYQPFHLGHLELLEIVIGKPEPFVVGIASPDPTTIREERGSAHRHRDDANPYSYFQRQRMIRDLLIDLGVPPRRYDIVPFPVSAPELWGHYLPRRVVHYMVELGDEWEGRKADRFRALGHDAIVLEVPRRMSATAVRARIASGEDWEAMVPAPVAAVLRDILAGSL